MKTWIKVYLSDEAKKEIEQAAEARHLSVSALAAYVLGEWLERERRSHESEEEHETNRDPGR